MNKEIKLSIVIVNYNVKYFLEQCLISVYKAIRPLAVDYYPFCADIWVVDNNSSDGSVEMVREKFPEVHIIANTDNKGFSAANNQAIRKSNAEFVLLLNPDTVVAEDTFSLILKFMDEHPDAGGLGVKMVDGKGNFLPESKRGLPTPGVAFFKIFGLSKLFPKSKLFGRYHLGFLDKNKNHVVEVLAGAFMLLRRKALQVSGLLDEDYFMYGEDIDLSYRISKAGYRNYYFSETSIIHYKGESTKKSSVNYVFVFYKAMVIFARKHFASNRAALFALVINAAIYLRATAAIVMRFLKKMMLPAADALLLYLCMILLVHYWEHTIKYVHGGKYPEILITFFIPFYVLFWILGLFFSKGYQRPFKAKKVISGAFWGTLLISIIYAFLDERYRFSRAIIILGGIISVIVFTFNRLVFRFIKDRKNIISNDEASKKIMIAGSLDEAKRVSVLLDKAEVNYNNLGIVSPSSNENGSYIGSIGQLQQLIKIYKADEVIFCARDIPFKDIILNMEQLKNSGPDFKIVPERSEFIIGSNSKNEPGDYYALSENVLSIERKESRINKRTLDIIASLILLISLPLNIWFVKNTATYLRNIFSVLSGKNTWVGYCNGLSENSTLPALKSGILAPEDELNIESLDEKTRFHLNYLYAKDYSVYSDISIILKGFANLGKG
jgi:O-antigen biosynthesis protein